MIRLSLCALSAAGVLLGASAFAQDLPQAEALANPAPAPADVVPPQNAPVTLDGELPSGGQYPLLRLTPDKIEVLKLDRDATNVIVGNSKHLLAVMETPRMVLLIPRMPGASHFQVLDAQGRSVMERAVIIAAPKQDYVRVRRTCSLSDNASGCKEFSVFYCPDMCHQVAVSQDESAAALDIPTQTASSPPASPAPDSDTGEKTGAESSGVDNSPSVP